MSGVVGSLVRGARDALRRGSRGQRPPVRSTPTRAARGRPRRSGAQGPSRRAARRPRRGSRAAPARLPSRSTPTASRGSARSSSAARPPTCETRSSFDVVVEGSFVPLCVAIRYRLSRGCTFSDRGIARARFVLARAIEGLVRAAVHPRACEPWSGVTAVLLPGRVGALSSDSIGSDGGRSARERTVAAAARRASPSPAPSGGGRAVGRIDDGHLYMHIELRWDSPISQIAQL